MAERRHGNGRRAAAAEAGKGKTRLLSSAELQLVKKDMKAVWSRSGRRALLIILPLMLVVAIPAVYFAAIALIPAEPGVRLPEATAQRLLPGRELGSDFRAAWLAVFTELLCPMLFLCVPILTGAASASYAFVMERESGTLETLLLTSMGPKSVYNAKITSCTLLSVLISAGAFLAFTATAAVANAVAGVKGFFRLDWLILLVLETPALSLFSVVFVALTVTRVHSTVESLQTMGYLILPVAAIYLMQLCGVFRLGSLALALIAAALGVADVVLFNAAGRGFTPEKLLERGAEESEG